ncbi:hypothetical protein M9434_006255 [Picochlorum sp. BPE23]|nr:hypothetical protein M9434_006255 [Picochlorum sp. BPE23]
MTPSVLPVEVYGFLGWITSSTFYVVFLVWAFTPDFILHWYGITYYPSKYWAIALPTWLCVTVVCVHLAYMCVNSMLESQIKTARAEHEDIQIDGNHQDSNECLFFNTSSDQGILPLVELPPDIVRMVMEESLPPLEAEKKYHLEKKKKKTSLKL